MKSFKEDFKPKLYVALAPAIILDEKAKETILTVSKTGAIHLYSLVPDYALYSIDAQKEQQQREQKKQMKKEKGSQNSNKNDQNKEIDNSYDQTAIYSKTIIRCIGKLNLIPDIKKVEVNFDENNNILGVSGFIHKRVPSIGVFRVTAGEIEIMHIESITGATGVGYNALSKSIVILPRLLSGSIITFKFNQEEIDPYHPEYISNFVVSCYGTKRATHMRINPINQYVIMTWSDDKYPFISFCDLKGLTWSREVYHFTLPSFILYAEFDPSGQKIGVVIYQHKKTLVGIWTLAEDKIEQNNFYIEENIQIYNAKWMPCISQTQAFCVWTPLGMYEANGSELILWKPEAVRSSMFTVSKGGFHVFFDKNGVLTIAGRKMMERDREDAQCVGTKDSPLSFIKASVSGKYYSANGAHMQRCMNCRHPLMYPLVSCDEGISACYCSGECQKNHWPLYFSSRQPLFFELDGEKLST
jgi:hypothetical protein